MIFSDFLLHYLGAKLKQQKRVKSANFFDFLLHYLGAKLLKQRREIFPKFFNVTFFGGKIEVVEERNILGIFTDFLLHYLGENCRSLEEKKYWNISDFLLHFFGAKYKYFSPPPSVISRCSLRSHLITLRIKEIVHNIFTYEKLLKSYIRCIHNALT